MAFQLQHRCPTEQERLLLAERRYEDAMNRALMPVQFWSVAVIASVIMVGLATLLAILGWVAIGFLAALGILGVAALGYVIAGTYCIVRRWWLRRRGIAACVRPEEQIEAWCFSADAAWVIEDAGGNSAAVLRVTPDEYVLLPTELLANSTPSGKRVDPCGHGADVQPLPWSGTLIYDRHTPQLSVFEAGGAPNPTPVLCCVEHYVASEPDPWGPIPVPAGEPQPIRHFEHLTLDVGDQGFIRRCTHETLPPALRAVVECPPKAGAGDLSSGL